MNRGMGRLGMVLPGILLAAVAVALVGRTSVAHEGEPHPFSNHTVKGSWGFNSSFANLVVPGAPGPLPAAGMGQVVFDGEGGCAVHSFANINGDTQELRSSSCTYNVRPDGIGTAEAFFPDAPLPGPLPVAFIIVDHAQELRFLNTKFLVSTFTARRQ